MTDRNTGKGATTMAKTEFAIKPGTQEIVMTRVFDAPRDLVFKAMMDPNAIPKWWGPRDHWTKVDKMDVRRAALMIINGDAGRQRARFRAFLSPHRCTRRGL